MRLRGSGTLEHAIQTLNERVQLVRNTTSMGRGIGAAQQAWLRWWEATDAQLRNLFVESDVAENLYRMALDVQHLDDGEGAYVHLGRIVEVSHAKLTELIAELKALRPIVSRQGSIVVPDTSAFIEGQSPLTAHLHAVARLDADEPVRIVIPIIVIEQLDDLKRRPNQRVAARAREVLRTLWVGAAPDGTIPLAGGTGAEILLDQPTHLRRPVEDVEIIDRALFLQELTGRSVTLLACDYAMLFRARQQGLAAVEMPSTATDAAATGDG